MNVPQGRTLCDLSPDCSRALLHFGQNVACATRCVTDRELDSLRSRMEDLPAPVSAGSGPARPG